MSATKKRKTDGGVEETQFNEEDKVYSDGATTSGSMSLESDFDELVGDLVKEELQLVLTRVVRDDPTLDVQVKKHILKVMNARNKNSAPNPTALKQLEQFAASFRQSQLILGAIGSQKMLAANGDGNNTLEATQLLAQTLQGGTGTDLPFINTGASSGSGLLQELSFTGGVNLLAIRRKVRDAFVSTSGLVGQKRGRFGAVIGDREIYRINSSIIRAEKEKAKEMILTKGEIRDGLNIMEAITSEYVMKGTELGVQNCEGYDDVLHEIAKDWVEIFLFENLDIEQSEREEWAKKLFDWDTSPNEEEGTFSTARYAAKLAWNNIHLRNVMKGESIGKFTEPKELSIARLNQLERDGRFEEGMNLSKAVDLDFYLARFLLKLERLNDAQQVAERLEDTSQIFSIAQLARASDVHVAFNLCLTAISKSIQWSSEVADRSRWLCDLSISNKMTELLCQKATQIIRHKSVQFHIARILKEKEQYQSALEICKIALKPYPEDEKLQKQQLDTPTTTTTSPSSPSTSTLLQYDEGAIVPNDLPTYLWELSHEMLILELLDDNGFNNVLNYIIENVDHVGNLIKLFNSLNVKKEYEQIVTLGEKLFEKISIQSKAHFELQRDLLKQVIVDSPDTMQAYVNGAQVSVIQQPVPVPTATTATTATTTDVVVNPLAFITDNEYFKLLARAGTISTGSSLLPSIHINFNYAAIWEQHRSAVAQRMIQAAFDSRQILLQSAAITTTSATPINYALLGIRPVKAMSMDRMKKIVDECLSNIDNIDTLTTIARLLQNGHVFDLAVQICDHLQQRITQIRQDKKKRDQIATEYSLLIEEREELQKSRKSLKPDQERRLRDLQYQSTLLQISGPPNLTYDESTYDNNYHYQTSLMAINVALDAKSPLFATATTTASEKFSSEKSYEIIDRHLTYIVSPHNLLQVISQINHRQEYELVIKIGLRAIHILQQLSDAKKVREEISVPLSIIQTEQEQLLEKRQTLPTIRLQEMKKLEQQLDALPTMEHFDSDDFDTYESQRANIARQVIQSSFNSKNNYENALAQQFRLQQQQQQVQLQQIVIVEALTDERIRQVTIQFANLLSDPSSLIQITKICSQYSNYELMLEIGTKCQDTIKNLSKERELRALPRFKYEQLKEEKERSIEQKKVMKPDQLQQLAQWEVEQQLNLKLLPKYAKKTMDQYDQDLLTLIKTMLDSVLTFKSGQTMKLKDIIQMEFTAMKEEQQATSSSNQMKDDDEEAVVDPKIELNQNIEKANQFISSIVNNMCSTVVENPNHLYTIASTLNDYNEYDLALSIGKIIQEKIPILLKEKRERDQVRNELNDLLDEEREIQEARKQVKNRRKKLDGDKAQKLEDLQIQVKMFNFYPKYRDSSPEQLDKLNLDNSILLIQAMIKSKNADEVEMELNTEMTESEKQTKRMEHDVKINNVIELCLQYVKNPKHILTILEKIKRNDLDLIFKIGKQAVHEATECETKKKERDVPEQLISIIRSEETDLELLRKQLPEAVQKQLEEAQDKLQKLDQTVEYYVVGNDYNTYDKWKYSAIQTILNAVLATKIDLENRIAYDHSLTTEQIEKETEEFNVNLKQIVDLLCDDHFGIHNPSSLSTIAATLQEKNEFKQAIHVGEKALAILEELKKAEEERKLPEQQYLILVQEKQKQLQQRNQLPVEQQDQLRELSLKHEIQSLAPSYTKLSQEQYDNISFSTSRIMINAALDLKKNIDDKMDADSQMQESEFERESNDALHFLEDIVDKCIAKISSVENVIRILQDMSARYEYGLVLRIGSQIQKTILYLKEQVAKIKKLEEEQTSLQQQLRLQKNNEIENRLAEIQVELSNLPIKYKGFYTLDNFTLTTSELMMKAAKVEEDNQVLLEQAIITFNITMTPEAYVEVKVLSGEDAWEKRRMELLKYIVAHIDDDKDVTDVNTPFTFSSLPPSRKKRVEPEYDDDEDSDEYSDSEEDYGSKRKRKSKYATKHAPKAKKSRSSFDSETSSLSVHRRATMKEKIQLLLDEGMWRSVVEIFPPVERGGTIDLLERVYIEVQKDNPDNIDDSLMKLVEQYVTRQYQQYEFESSKSLLDLVEKHNRKFIEDMYDKISETLLMTIVPKQYTSFVEFLKVVKDRLTKYSVDDDDEDEESEEEDTKRRKSKKTPKKKAKQLPPWEKFFENLMKKHKGKKKLIQAIQLDPALGGQQ